MKQIELISKTENIRFDNTNTYFSCFAYDQDETFYCIYSIKTNDIYYCEYDSSNSKFKTEVVLTTMSNNSGIVVETVKNIRGTGMNGYGIALVTPGNLIYLFSFDVDEKTATHSITMTNIIQTEITCSDMTLISIQLDLNEHIIIRGYDGEKTIVNFYNGALEKISITDKEIGGYQEFRIQIIEDVFYLM